MLPKRILRFFVLNKSDFFHRTPVRNPTLSVVYTKCSLHSSLILLRKARVKGDVFFLAV